MLEKKITIVTTKQQTSYSSPNTEPIMGLICKKNKDFPPASPQEIATYKNKNIY